MSDINKLFITGRLTRDAEVYVAQNGQKLTKFSVANATGYGDKERTSFFNVTLFGKYGEALAPKLSQGVQVMIEGLITITSNKDNNGNYKTYVNVSADHVEIGKAPSGRSQSTGSSYKPEVHDMGNPEDFGTVDVSADDLPF